MMGRKLLLPLCAVFIIYSLVILARYGSGYPELATLDYFAYFILYVIGAKLLFMLALAMSAFGYGGAVFRRWLPDPGPALDEGLFKVSLGLIIISYLLFFIGLAGLVYPMAGYVVLAAGLGLGARGIPAYLKRVADLPRGFRLTLTAVVLVSLAASFLLRGLYGALLPPTGFDVLMYHLGVPRMYLDAHRIFPTPDINGSYFPFGVEMLYMLGMLVDSAISANMVNYSFAVAGGLAAYAFTKRYVGGASPLLAFTVYVSIPLVFWLMPQAYVELGLAAYAMLAMYALVLSFEKKDSRWLVMAAVFAGFTMAVKYTGLVIVAIAACVIFAHYLARERSGLKGALKAVGIFLAVSTAVAAPWYVRNVFYYGNPVYPYLANLFGGGPSGVSEATSAFWAGGITEMSARYISSFWKTTFSASSYQAGGGSGIGPYFLMLIPGVLMFALLFRDLEREIKLLMVFCFVYYTVMIPADNIRYLSPIFPALAVLAAYPVGRLLNGGSKPARAAGVLLVVLFSFSALLANTGRDAVSAFPSSSPDAAGRYYSETMASGYLASYDTWNWINTNLPQEAVIYQLWDDASVYFRHRKTLGSSLPFGPTGRQRIQGMQGFNGFGGYLPGQEIIGNLRGMGAGYLLINANREGRQLPGDPYFQAHTRLLIENKNVFLFQLIQ